MKRTHRRLLRKSIRTAGAVTLSVLACAAILHVSSLLRPGHSSEKDPGVSHAAQAGQGDTAVFSGQAGAVLSAEDIHLTLEAGTIPRLYQWDELWANYLYGESTMEEAGCGPTCLSMVVMGLTGSDQWNPVAVADYSMEQGYKTSDGTSWELMTTGASHMGVTGTELPLDENRMIQELANGHPIICSMRPGDFTDTGHFIVLTGYDGKAFTVNDPNSEENSSVTWTYERLKGQIKNLWAFSLDF